LRQHPSEINVQFLGKFPEFRDFQKLSKEKPGISEEQASVSQTPEELLESSYQRLGQELALELLQTIKACSP
jgi:restriction system protein